VNRYIKGILGGLLAILAAFGWTVAIAYLLWWKPELLGIRIVGIRVVVPFWLTLFLIFSVEFYLAFRAAYRSKNSN
jgi:hypothetical protein